MHPIDLVTDLKPHPNRSDKTFQAGSRIQRALGYAAEIIEVPEESAECCRPIIKVEVDKSALDGSETDDRSFAGRMELRSEKSVEDPHVGSVKTYRARCRAGERFSKTLLKIVGQLRLKLGIRAQGNGSAAAQSPKVLGCLRKPEVVGEHTDFHMLLCVSGRSKNKPCDQDRKTC